MEKNQGPDEKYISLVLVTSLCVSISGPRVFFFFISSGLVNLLESILHIVCVRYSVFTLFAQRIMQGRSSLHCIIQTTQQTYPALFLPRARRLYEVCFPDLKFWSCISYCKFPVGPRSDDSLHFLFVKGKIFDWFSTD